MPWVSPTEPHRGLSVTVAGLLRMCGAVHEMSSGCPGPLTKAVFSQPRSDSDNFSAKCQTCAAVFARIPVNKPSPKSIALGVLFAGGTIEHFSHSSEYSDCQSPSITTLGRHLPSLCNAVDKVFTETIAENKLKCKREPGRGLVKIAPDKHYFVANATRLEEMMEAGLSVEVFFHVERSCGHKT